MTVTLLVDLDGTLLANEMSRFLPAYFSGLQEALRPHALPDRMLTELLAATNGMLGSLDPTRTLKETFDARFYPALGFAEADLAAPIRHFYENGYGNIRGVTSVIPSAAPFVEAARARGWRLVLATNPLFPATAIHQRLAWAGIPVEHFDLIADYETAHFTKPSPAYYAELLGKLGWENGAVVMVGDDPVNDIRGAGELGLATFMVTPGGMGSPDGTAAPRAAARGSLGEVIPWVESQPQEALTPNYRSPQAVQAVFRSTIAVLKGWLDSLPDTAWLGVPPGETWSLRDLVCHLRDVERLVNLPRLEMWAAAPNPFIQGVDTDYWVASGAYRQTAGQPAFAEFIAARLRLLDELAGLSDADWARPARHNIFGPTDFLELMCIAAGHDQLHVRQARQVLAAQTRA